MTRIRQRIEQRRQGLMGIWERLNDPLWWLLWLTVGLGVLMAVFVLLALIQQFLDH